jgi:hypothetical protein
MKQEHPGIITVKYGYMSLLLLAGTFYMFVLGAMAMEARDHADVWRLMFNTPLSISRYVLANIFKVSLGLAGLTWVFYAYGTMAGNLIKMFNDSEVVIGRITVFLIYTTIYLSTALVQGIAESTGWNFTGFWYVFTEMLGNWIGLYASITTVFCLIAGHLLGLKIKNNVLANENYA